MKRKPIAYEVSLTLTAQRDVVMDKPDWAKLRSELGALLECAGWRNVATEQHLQKCP